MSSATTSSELGQHSARPLRLFVITLISVGVAEVIIMVVLSLMPPLPVAAEAVVDGLLLTFLVVPLLYLSLFRPMAAQIDRRRKAEEELRKANLELEGTVEERTADLFSTDKRLTGEIEKRSSAENELWKSHEFLLSVIESAPSLMLIYDASTRQCLYVNGRIVDLLGYTPEEVCLQGSDFFRTVLEREDYLSFVKSHTSAQTGVSTSIMDGPHRLRHASGDWRRCYLKSTVLAGTSDDLPREMLLTAIESDR